MKLNCDLGEGYDFADAAIMPLIDQASIACGGHAGNEASMAQCVALAKQFGVEVGAHPSYPDQENFGRLSVDISHDDLRQSIKEQISSLYRHCSMHCVELSYVKLHGALYNDSAKDPLLFVVVADTVCELCREYDLPAIALMVPGSVSKQHISMAEQRGLSLLFEGFIDRAYSGDGALVSRKQNGSVHRDKSSVLRQVKQFAKMGGVRSINGVWISMVVDSLCVHGDTENAIELVKMVRVFLDGYNELQY